MNRHIADNSLGTLFRYFKSELQAIYNEREAGNITVYVFQEKLGLSRLELALNREMKLSESDILKVHFALKRLKQGEPVQYVTGNAHFLDMNLAVTTDVLIPRPETEELVQWIAEINRMPYPVILDIGTGSGCISLGLKKLIPQAVVYAMDISVAALAVADANSRKLNLPIHIICQDALDSIAISAQPDIIVSNPPYILEAEKEFMDSHVAEHEPELALFVMDEDPLLFYRSIAYKALEVLPQNGLLFFELHEQNGTAVKNLLENYGYESIELKKDLQGKIRMIKAVNSV